MFRYNKVIGNVFVKTGTGNRKPGPNSERQQIQTVTAMYILIYETVMTVKMQRLWRMVRM